MKITFKSSLNSGNACAIQFKIFCFPVSYLKLKFKVCNLYERKTWSVARKKEDGTSF
jgi:hypothetical protein